MTNTHEQQQDSQPLHRPIWRTSTGLGRQRSRFQNLPTEVLLIIIEQVLQPEAQKSNMQALAEHLYLGLLNDRFRELITPILESYLRSNFSRSTNASNGTTSQTDPSGLYSYILILSTIRGFPEGVIATLDHGADINANDSIDKSLTANGMVDGKRKPTGSFLASCKPEPRGSCLTALHWAAFNRDTAMLRLLLNRGADVRRTAHVDRYLSGSLVNALGFALQANYGVLPSGMTEQQRQAFVVDRGTRDEEAVRILIEAGCTAFVEKHREGELSDACEEGRWGVARDILANTEWKSRRRDEKNFDDDDDNSPLLSLVCVVMDKSSSGRLRRCYANEW
ncbi:hypothetical protein CSIM01_12036 [Colletotrichum simmondsii]|uniref:Uncharacterized protein n=1 Tax=Colletotrichum simmondsii TaxID=703756 RepID=A0A135RUP3_9PEZI|nr:hypothetical protein CSIM01_12036 [Colletotrichum simmondsii]